MERSLLGEITIESINQIGESLKYDPKTNGFLLARRGSVFSIYTHIDQSSNLTDFRDAASILVSMESDGKLLAVNPANGKAEAIEADGCAIPDNAIFHYVRKKFDGSTTSISTLACGEERWLRHCNAKLRFDLRGTGSNFAQDASFMLRAYDKDGTRRSTPSRSATKRKAGGSSGPPSPSTKETDENDSLSAIRNTRISETATPANSRRVVESETPLPDLQPVVCETSPPRERAASPVEALWERIDRIMKRVKENEMTVRSLIEASSKSTNN